MLKGEAVLHRSVESSNPTNVEEPNSDGWWTFVEQDRFWKGLLIFGIFLNLWIASTSALGHDTHVRLAMDDDGILPWGHTRPIDTQANDPSYSPSSDGWNTDLVTTGGEGMVRIISMMWMLLLMGVAGAVISIGSNSNEEKRSSKWSLRVAALVAIYPTFIFSTGRGYQEPVVALFLLLAIVPQLLKIAEKNLVNRTGATVISMFFFGGILTAKSVPLEYSLVFGAALMLLFGLDHFAPHLRKVTRKPLVTSSLAGGGVAAIMLVWGATGGGGTLSVIADEPIRFGFALLISIFDLVVVYALFGMVLWPFVGAAITRLREIEDLDCSFLLAIIAGLTSALIVYVAALWTYESVRWNAEWPWVMWTMGNNGRYISLVMVPVLILLARLNQLDDTMPSLEKTGDKMKSVALGLILIVPISMLAAFHGQTFWVDDAGEYLSDKMEDGEDFLFVDDATLGMHDLYVFHTEISLDDPRNITGHWRSPDSGWEVELSEEQNLPNRGNLSRVQWIVLAPEITWDMPSEWNMVKSGKADYLNGGGEWQIWTNQ